jgi:AraC-like DNA-binding protein
VNGRAWGTGHGTSHPIPDAPCPIPHSPFRYAEYQPSRQAETLVLSYWSFQSDAALPPDERYTVFPDGCASIAVVRPSVLALVGPRLSPLHPPVYQGTRIWGIRLWPDAIEPVLGVEAASVRDHFGALPEPAASRFAGLMSALPSSDDVDTVFPVLDAWVRTALHDLPDPDPRVRAAIREIVRRHGEGSLPEVARTAAIGLRHLQRLFPRTTGLTLREFARIRRLREALALRLTSAEPNWSRIAAQTGFVDHAHLAREFVALAGVAPGAAASQLRTTAHHQVRP